MMKKFREISEAIKDKYDIGEYDQEGDMAKSDLRSIIANSKRVHDMLEDDDNLPEWVQSKITKAEDYMSTVANYMEAEMNEEAGASKKQETTFHKKLDTLVHKTFGKRKEEMKEDVKMPKQTRAEKEYRKITGKTVDQRMSELDKVQKDLAKQKEDYIKQGIIKAESVEQVDEVLDTAGKFMSYATKAAASGLKSAAMGTGKFRKRQAGIQTAVRKTKEKIANEEVEIEEGIGGTIAGGIGQFIGNKIDPLHGEIMRAHGEVAGRAAEYTIRKHLHRLHSALKKHLSSGTVSEEVELDESNESINNMHKGFYDKTSKSKLKKVSKIGSDTYFVKSRSIYDPHESHFKTASGKYGSSMHSSEGGVPSHEEIHKDIKDHNPHLSKDEVKKAADVVHAHMSKHRLGEEVELDEGKYGSFRVRMTSGTFGGPKLPRRGYGYVPQGDTDPRTGLPLGFSHPPKKDEPKKVKEEVEQIDEISAEVAKRVAQARDKSAENYKLTPTQSRRLGMGDKGGEPDLNAAKALKSAMKRGAKNVYGEEVELLDEKNKPTNPELWGRAKALARQKFDVYPSAYANGWAAKWYKSKGGGWRSVSEDVDLEEGYFKSQETERQETERLAKRNEPPFTPDKPKKKSVVVGKKPEGYSRARQLARQAMQKYKTPVKEEKDMSKKAKVVKDIMKKSSDDKFQAKPELSDSVTRNL